MHRKLVGALAALIVGACASPYVATPYERQAAGVTTVAIADDSVPERLSAWEAASVGSNFGLIGALADAGIQQSREDEMMIALEEQNFDAEAVLEARILTGLTQHGYQASAGPEATRERRVFLASYDGAPTEATFDLVVTNYGYISSGAFQPWRPTVEATVRLVRNSDNQTLMENQIALNSMYVREGVITLSANPEYQFQNREAMLADPARLAAGLEDALNQVADTATGLVR